MSRKFLSDRELEEILMNDSDVDDIQNIEGPEESDGDISDGQSEHSKHDSDSEQQISDEEYEDIPQEIFQDRDASLIDVPEAQGNPSTASNYFYGKNRYKWAKNEPRRDVRTAACNVIRTHLPGLKGQARLANLLTPYDAWRLLFTDDILEIILEHTNAKISDLSTNYTVHVSFLNHLDMSELKAFIGLIILAGVFKSGREDVASLWAANGKGRDIFRATMSLKRFLFLLTALRFDNAESRVERIAAGDNAAAISEIFNRFIENCSANYSCSEYVTVDEMLVPFRGKCKFRMYLKSKPAKYGIKIMCLCDAKTHFLLNAFIYTGKNTQRRNPKKLSVPTLDVLELVRPIENTNRNVTGDNWFTSVELVDELKAMGLTYVGTVRKNKREVPLQFQPNKQRKVNSSVFGFTGDRTLASYVPKKNKCVIMLSSMHHSSTVDEESGKPEIIQFYNSTKTGVDTLDQKCASYSGHRRSRRWPLTIFYAIINISRVNSFVIYKAANLDDVKTRRVFNIELGEALINEQLHERMTLRNISRELKGTIAKVLNIPVPAHENINPNPAKRMRCGLCPRSNDRKYPTKCFKCAKAVCKQHCVQKIVCNLCEAPEM